LLSVPLVVFHWDIRSINKFKSSLLLIIIFLFFGKISDDIALQFNLW